MRGTAKNQIIRWISYKSLGAKVYNSFLCFSTLNLQPSTFFPFPELY